MKNNRKVFRYRFANKVCKLESQAMSSELKLLDKVQKQEGSENSPTNQCDIEV